MKLSAALFVLIFNMAYIVGTEGCSCVPGDPRSQYCRSDFAVIGKITGRTKSKRWEVTYDIDITKVYKGVMSTGSAKIKTAAEDSMCGVHLDINNVYLLNGYKREDELWINTCGMMSFFPVNDPDTNIPLDSYYDCRCKVLNIYPFPDELIPKNTCSLGGRFRCPPDSGALGDMAECRYSEANDSCAWEC